MIKTPDFVQFILDDTHSRVLSKYIKDLENRINKALHLIRHNDIYDYRVFEEMLKEILKGDNNE